MSLVKRSPWRYCAWAAGPPLQSSKGSLVMWAFFPEGFQDQGTGLFQRARMWLCAEGREPFCALPPDWGTGGTSRGPQPQVGAPVQLCVQRVPSETSWSPGVHIPWGPHTGAESSTRSGGWRLKSGCHRAGSSGWP